VEIFRIEREMMYGSTVVGYVLSPKRFEDAITPHARLGLALVLLVDVRPRDAMSPILVERESSGSLVLQCKWTAPSERRIASCHR